MPLEAFFNNPYFTLGIPSCSSERDVKKAFHKLALKHHPDKGGNKNIFILVTEARYLLSDSTKAAEYKESIFQVIFIDNLIRLLSLFELTSKNYNTQTESPTQNEVSPENSEHNPISTYSFHYNDKIKPGLGYGAEVHFSTTFNSDNDLSFYINPITLKMKDSNIAFCVYAMIIDYAYLEDYEQNTLEIYCNDLDEDVEELFNLNGYKTCIDKNGNGFDYNTYLPANPTMDQYAPLTAGEDALFIMQCIN